MNSVPRIGAIERLEPVEPVARLREEVLDDRDASMSACTAGCRACPSAGLHVPSLSSAARCRVVVQREAEHEDADRIVVRQRRDVRAVVRRVRPAERRGQDPLAAHRVEVPALDVLKNAIWHANEP